MASFRGCSVRPCLPHPKTRRKPLRAPSARRVCSLRPPPWQLHRPPRRALRAKCLAGCWPRRRFRSSAAREEGQRRRPGCAAAVLPTPSRETLRKRRSCSAETCALAALPRRRRDSRRCLLHSQQLPTQTAGAGCPQASVAEGRRSWVCANAKKCRRALCEPIVRSRAESRPRGFPDCCSAAQRAKLPSPQEATWWDLFASATAAPSEQQKLARRRERRQRGKELPLCAFPSRKEKSVATPAPTAEPAPEQQRRTAIQLGSFCSPQQILASLGGRPAFAENLGPPPRPSLPQPAQCPSHGGAKPSPLSSGRNKNTTTNATRVNGI